MEADLTATYDACSTFNNKLADTIRGLINANSECKSEIDTLKANYEKLKNDHDGFVSSTERENDLRKNEIKSLEEKQQKDNQGRISDIAKLEGKLDTENSARKAEIAALDSWAKGENDARKTDIANLDNFSKSENAARKTEIANLDNFSKSENDARKADIADINSRLEKANADRANEDKALSDRLEKEVSDRDIAIKDLQERMDSQNEDKGQELDALRTRMMKENAFLKSMAGKPLSVYFDAFRTKAYDGGGEENLTFNGVSCNVGGGMDPGSGIFTAPLGGCYMFIFHIATHDNKKALLSIRLNGEEVASVFDQNHKDNHKNSMAGTNILLHLKRGDEVVVYAYTGTWLADFPMNHYTHWVGLLLKPSDEAYEEFKKQADEEVDAAIVANNANADDDS